MQSPETINHVLKEILPWNVYVKIKHASCIIECKSSSLLSRDLLLVFHPDLIYSPVPDDSNITEMRKVYKDAFLKKHGIKLGFMSAFVKAAAYALVDQPAVNAGMFLQPQLVMLLMSPPHNRLLASICGYCGCMFCV